MQEGKNILNKKQNLSILNIKKKYKFNLPYDSYFMSGSLSGCSILTRLLSHSPLFKNLVTLLIIFLCDLDNWNSKASHLFV